jgi:monofunctional biosynthetic peptidoglycan transglycosylase
MKFFKWTLGILTGLFLAAFLFIIFLYLSLPDVSFLINHNPTTTAYIDLRRAQAKEKGVSFDLKWTWIPLSQIPPSLLHTVIFREDTLFWTHGGVAWDQAWIAAKVNWEIQQIKYGASTITQQVARNLFLSPERTPQRKIKEWLLAYKLEHSLSKERILEIYLNIAEWGHAIFGAEAASQYWFKTTANSLTPRQAVRLVMTLPNPIKRAANMESQVMEFEINRSIIHLGNEGVLGDKEVMQSLWLGK